MSDNTINKAANYLSNKYVFIGLIILSITILTTINNYYFYDYVSVTNDRNAKKIKIITDAKLALCADNNISVEICTNNIISTVNEAQKYYRYLNKIVIKDAENQVLWEKEKYNHDHVSTLSVIVNLPDFENSKKSKMVLTKQWSNTALLLSVYRSMTFSATQNISILMNKGKDEAVKHIKRTSWYRSRPALGYTIFTIFLFLLYRRREQSITESINAREEKIVKEEQKRIHQEHLNKSKDEIIRDLEGKIDDIGQKIQEHDSVINPPMNTLKYDQFLDLDPESIIFKCRKVAEKLVIKIYNEQIGSNERIPFYKRIEQLSKEKIIDSKIVSYINSVKAFGNISAHPNVDNPVEFSREDAVMVSNTLIRLIEELDERDLLK